MNKELNLLPMNYYDYEDLCKEKKDVTSNKEKLKENNIVSVTFTDFTTYILTGNISQPIQQLNS